MQNCINNGAYTSNTYVDYDDVVFTATRNFYNAIYDNVTEHWSCQDPLIDTVKSIPLYWVAQAISDQYDPILDPTKGSMGNPFTYLVAGY